MQPSPTISIPTPCSVDRNQFIELTQGSYCQSCEKQVVDYTRMSDRELLQALRQNSTGCGSFRTDQLDRPLIENQLIKRGYSLAAIAMLLALQLCSLGVYAQDSSIKSQAFPTTALVTPIKSNSTSIAMNPTLQSLQIIDDAGYPLSQATVAILNTSNEIIGGEATDSSGYAILKLDASAKSIRVSYIGYEHVEMLTEKIGDGLIELHPLSSKLPEATVTAYRGSSKKIGFTSGSVSSTSGIVAITSRKDPQPRNLDTTPVSKLNLFPNPSQGHSTLKGDLLKDGRLINIYSSTGQLVQSLPVHTQSEGQLPIDLPPRFGSGTYIVELVLASGFAEVVKWVVVR